MARCRCPGRSIRRGCSSPNFSPGRRKRCRAWFAASPLATARSEAVSNLSAPRDTRASRSCRRGAPSPRRPPSSGSWSMLFSTVACERRSPIQSRPEAGAREETGEMRGMLPSARGGATSRRSLPPPDEASRSSRSRPGTRPGWPGRYGQARSSSRPRRGAGPAARSR